MVEMAVATSAPRPVSAMASVEIVPSAPIEAISITSVAEMVVVAPAAERPAVALPRRKIPTIVFEAITVTVAPSMRTFKPIAVAPVAVTIEAAAIPRTDANEHSAHEIVWTVVTVRRAVIRIIIIVAVRAGGRRDVHPFAIRRADGDADRHLSLGVARRKQEQSKQSNVL